MSNLNDNKSFKFPKMEMQLILIYMQQTLSRIFVKELLIQFIYTTWRYLSTNDRLTVKDAMM